MRIERINTKQHSKQKTPVDLSLLNPIIEKYNNKKGRLIPLLQETQSIYGYIPQQAFEKLSKEAGLEISDMYGVATFYAQFRLKPVGKNIIRVCHGTACHVQNSDAITEALQNELKIKDGETSEDGLFTLESVACLGCCSLAPVMMVNNETYGKLTKDKAVKIIKNIKIRENN